MKANEFVKKFGWYEAKRIINPPFKGYLPQVDVDNVDFSFEDLKRLTESHELINIYDGLDVAKDCLTVENFKRKNLKHWNRLKQAIADVESCQ